MTKPEKEKIQQLIDLLKFVMTVDDEEVINATISSVIENLEEMAS